MPKSRKDPLVSAPHAADQLVAPPRILQCIRRMLSSAPLKAQSPQIVECLKTIDLVDADMELERLLSRNVARLGDLDGDHDADVGEFVLFLICRS